MKASTKMRRIQRIIARGIGNRLTPRQVAQQIQAEVEYQSALFEELPAIQSGEMTIDERSADGTSARTSKPHKPA